MMRSMTGYGRYEAIWNDAKLTVEIRAVNHRFCEISVRLPRHLMLFEDRIKKIVHGMIHRGRVDVYVSFNTEWLVKKKLLVDWELVQAYYQSGKEIRERLGMKEDISIQTLLSIDELFQIEEELTEIEDTYSHVLLESIKKAAEHLIQMRIKEGETLVSDLKNRIHIIQEQVRMVQRHAPKVKEAYAEKLNARLKEWLPQQIEIDACRWLTEIALFAEKADISEEITRLNSHCEQFSHLLELSSEPVGRKLDFLVQEMNREVNTIGSKANDINISQIVVELKSQLEKIKEQVQNIE